MELINNTEEYCNHQRQQFVSSDKELWCNWVWDTVLCWPPTKASSTIYRRCPMANGIDVSKNAERSCGTDGKWQGQSDDENSVGWTNYTPCFTPELLLLIQKLYTGNKDEANVKLDIAENTRTLEFVGLSISLIALLLSLAVFFRFRSLRNTRTWIHKNLFVAMVMQVIIRLILYIDQALHHIKGINNTPIVCEATYVLLEYARSAMFMWMFIEGFFLHNLITITVFQDISHYWIYQLVGWGIPMLMTLIWALITAYFHRPTNCWWGYNLTNYFWILEGPRMGILLLNLIFLLNIIRVLVIKLRQSHTSETVQARKAVRAAFVLLPLLGITNLTSMTEAPLHKTIWFAFWSYSTYFLSSFQGLFISCFYCFLNGEVKEIMKKTICMYLSARDDKCLKKSTLSKNDPESAENITLNKINLEDHIICEDNTAIEPSAA